MDQKRRALTYLGHDVVIEPRTFFQLAQGASHWATLLRESGVRPGDRILVVAGATPDWVEVMLGALKIGAVTVSLHRAADGIGASTSGSPPRGAKVAVASSRAELELARCTRVRNRALPRRGWRRGPPTSEGRADSRHGRARRRLHRLDERAENGPRGVLHTHAATFAARVHAEHWLDAGLGDVVWCTSPGALAADAVEHAPRALGARCLDRAARRSPFDPAERLDLMQRLGVTVLCQSPDEYRALAETGRLGSLPLGTAAPPRVHGRRARGRRRPGVRGRVGPDHPGRARTGGGGGLPRSLGRRRSARIARSARFPATTSRSSTSAATSCPTASPATSRCIRARRRSSPATGTLPTRRSAAYRGDWFVTGDVAVRDEDGFFWLDGRRDTRRRRPAAPSVELPVEEPHAPAAPVPSSEPSRASSSRDPFPSRPPRLCRRAAALDLRGSARTSRRSAPTSPGSPRRSGCSRPVS